MAPIAPVSLASSVIGFISFAFTFATFLRIFWENFSTYTGASREVKDYMGNLKQVLYEERDHLRVARRRQHKSKVPESHADDGTGSLEILSDTMRNMVREFKMLERPFLRMERDDNDIDLDKSIEIFKADYECLDASQRFAWLRTKGQIVGLAQRLDLIRSRRIAKTVDDALVCVQAVQRSLRNLDDRLWSIDERLRGGGGGAGYRPDGRRG